MNAPNKADSAHLVGSAPFDTTEDMFRFTMEYMGEHIKRLPDGEVGERNYWIRWQYQRIGQSQQMEVEEKDNIYVPLPPYHILSGISDAEDIEFPNLGYGDAAIESYATFEDLVRKEVIPERMRFMIGLPTPLSVASFYVVPRDRDMFQQAYGRALGQELKKIIESVPAEKLAIQWEVVTEFALLEGIVENHIDGDLMNFITSHVASLVDLVPERVDAGLHLCYGDSGHKHFCEPIDTGHLVNVANGVNIKSNRNIDWIHMPVPKERDDEAYYLPLSNLKLKATTELFLGLVHNTGGQKGTEKRMESARKVMKKFGISTECGLARRQQDTMPDLMVQHANLSEELKIEQ